MPMHVRLKHQTETETLNPPHPLLREGQPPYGVVIPLKNVYQTAKRIVCRLCAVFRTNMLKFPYDFSIKNFPSVVKDPSLSAQSSGHVKTRKYYGAKQRGSHNQEDLRTESQSVRSTAQQTLTAVD